MKAALAMLILVCALTISIVAREAAAIKLEDIYVSEIQKCYDSK